MATAARAARLRAACGPGVEARRRRDAADVAFLGLCWWTRSCFTSIALGAAARTASTRRARPLALIAGALGATERPVEAHDCRANIARSARGHRSGTGPAVAYAAGTGPSAVRFADACGATVVGTSGPGRGACASGRRGCGGTGRFRRIVAAGFGSIGGAIDHEKGPLRAAPARY